MDFIIIKLSGKAKIVRVREVSRGVLAKARSLAEEFDVDDYPFIAVALEYNASIWTNDKNLIRHALTSNEYLAIDTQALERLLEGEEPAKVLEAMKEKYLAANY